MGMEITIGPESAAPASTLIGVSESGKVALTVAAKELGKIVWGAGYAKALL